MNKKCLCLTKGLEKDQELTFERDSRKVILKNLEMCRAVAFAHSLKEEKEFLLLVKEKKPDRILFNAFPKFKIKEIIIFFDKKFPGNKFTYGTYSDGVLEAIDKVEFLKENQKVLAEA
jgi:hypothetical protein